MNNYRLLKANEIDVRVGTVGAKGVTLLLYKDARVDMTILDETHGSEFWQRDHKEIKGNMYAGVGVWNKEIKEWVWKWDCGTESFTEKEKGEASDSFKRACVNEGIGRELYTSPFIFSPCETVAKGERYTLKAPYEFSGCKVKDISYDENREISALKIANKQGKIIFSFGFNTINEMPETKIKMITPTEVKAIENLAENVGSKIEDICKAYQVFEIKEMTQKQFVDCQAKLKVKEKKNE